MKKKALEKEIRKLAKRYGTKAGIDRQGGSHEIWVCAGFKFSMPRHREINERTAQTILKDLTKYLEDEEQS